jgi:hypothetical protein
MTRAITFARGSPGASQDDGLGGLLDRRIDQANLLGSAEPLLEVAVTAFGLGSERSGIIISQAIAASFTTSERINGRWEFAPN